MQFLLLRRVLLTASFSAKYFTKTLSFYAAVTIFRMKIETEHAEFNFS